MIEPTLALQTAVRAALIASPELTALVPADHIRAGSTRPEQLPCIRLAPIATQNLGHAADGSQFLARVLLDLHVWAVDDGQDTAWQIGFAACNALRYKPTAHSFDIDEWEFPNVRWLRDPDQDKTFNHGIISLNAVIRWRF